MKNSAKDISIIIVTYNSSNYIINCLSSIIRAIEGSNFEIILIDNNSTDDSVEIVKQIEYPLNVILNHKNVGFARACNQGIKLANAKYIFLLNPDTELLNDCLSIFFDFMENKENDLVWCVGAKIYDEYNNPSKSYGHFSTFLDIISEQFGIKGLLLKIPKIRSSIRNKAINQNTEVPFIIGCDMFIRLSVLDKIGLFNEQFFLNFEETELSWRAQKAGFKSIVLPEANILHYSSKSFPNLQSYLTQLWFGQLLFFKLTHNHFIFLLAKVIHLIGSMLRFILKFDENYLKHAKKILSV